MGGWVVNPSNPQSGSPIKAEGYWAKHHTGIIQCVFGFYCCIIATLAYFFPRPVPNATAPLSGGGATSTSYSMPWYLWIGIVGLSLSVIIPAIFRMMRKRSDIKESDALRVQIATMKNDFGSRLKQVEENQDRERKVWTSELEQAKQSHVDEVRRVEALHKSELYRTQQFRDGYKEERDQARQELQDAKAQRNIFDTEIYRTRVGPKNPFPDQTKGAYQAITGGKEFKIGVDILLEMYVVNVSSERQYIREVCGHVQVENETFPLVMQTSFEAWELNDQEFEWCLDPTPKERGSFYDRQQKLEALLPLSASYPAALEPKKPLEGWVRLLIAEIDPDKLKGVKTFNLAIKDSLGMEHPITKLVERTNRGEISTRPMAKV